MRKAGFVLSLAIAVAFPAHAQKQAVGVRNTPAVDLPVAATASGSLQFSGITYKIELATTDDQAVLWFSPRGSARRFPFQITRINDALIILSNKQFEPLWPALLRWTGDDMGKMRERVLARAKAAYDQGYAAEAARSTGQSAVSFRTRAIMQYADALAETGFRDVAIRLLREELVVAKRERVADGFDAAILGLRSSMFARSWSDYAAGLAMLDEAQKGLELAPDYRLNFDINRAAMLAEIGRYREALNLIEAAKAQFDEEARRNGTGIGGSDRQFAWIRACALRGLGRKAEAATALAPTVQAPPNPTDPRYVVQDSGSIRFRARLCMRDMPAMLDDMRAGLRAGVPLEGVLLWLQPEFAVDPGPVADAASAMRGDARIQAAAAGRFRPLPPKLIPALNRWAVAPPVPFAPR